MKHIARKVAGVLATAGIVPVLLAGAAHADPGTVYFSSGAMQCSITGDGTVGCDLGSPMRLQYSFLPIPIPVNDIVIDQPLLPAHPTFAAGARYTLPGGNPNLSGVRTADGQWGPIIEHAGAKCESGFHGSFTCTTKGHSFTVYSGNISA
ncbi:hypothetical protein [Nocardia brevicatena]|uniref:hypothetical protein n=1 Tax=Nocardia brevicatena TaxID=37327 RepID=UPI0005942EAA|nr:hypothetical protein [Nocardia brevicatena]